MRMQWGSASASRHPERRPLRSFTRCIDARFMSRSTSRADVNVGERRLAYKSDRIPLPSRTMSLDARRKFKIIIARIVMRYHLVKDIAVKRISRGESYWKVYEENGLSDRFFYTGEINYFISFEHL